MRCFPFIEGRNTLSRWPFIAECIQEKNRQNHIQRYWLRKKKYYSYGLYWRCRKSINAIKKAESRYALFKSDFAICKYKVFCQLNLPSRIFFFFYFSFLKSQKGAAPFSFWLTLSIYCFLYYLISLSLSLSLPLFFPLIREIL